jgi:hypothetical protein
MYNIKMIIREICYEDEKWVELGQDCVQWQALVLVVLNLWVLLPESKLVSQSDLREICCEDER